MPARLHNMHVIGLIATMIGLGGAPTGCHTSHPVGTHHSSRHEFRQLLMGVQTRVVLYTDSPQVARNAARVAFDEIARLNAIMSDYNQSSEIMRLVRQEIDIVHPVSTDLHAVLAAGQALNRQTHGAFDVTVGPLVQLWRQARRDGKLPDPAAIARARSRVGGQLLEVGSDGVMLTRPDTLLDLGGIAKGYAAQRAVELLKALGHHRCLVALAGDIVTGDPPPGEEAWSINVQTGNTHDAGRQLMLANRAVSTSGDTAQFVEIDGIRYSHIVDPRSGIGLTNRTAATVIAPDGMTADSLASAICVLGIEHAALLIEQTPGCAAIVEQVTPVDGITVRIIDPAGVLPSIQTLPQEEQE